jgi:tetratricopeptide (TPR) repeat protein
MDNSTHNEELLKYFDGEMNATEKEIFERTLSSSPDLQQELGDLQTAKQALRSYGLQQQVAALHAELMHETGATAVVRPIGNTRRIIRYTIGIAAGIVLICFCVLAYQFLALSTDRVYAEQYQGFELSNTRGQAKASPAIDSAYKKKNYKAVIDIRRKAASLTASDQFIAGLSFLELNDPMSAIVAFKAAMNLNRSSAEQSYEDEAEYYLALAYLKNRDYDQALAEMRAIRNNPNHLYHNAFPSKFITEVKMLKWR